MEKKIKGYSPKSEFELRWIDRAMAERLSGDLMWSRELGIPFMGKGYIINLNLQTQLIDSYLF